MKKLLFLTVFCGLSLTFLPVTGCKSTAAKVGTEMAETGETRFRIELPDGIESDSVAKVVKAALLKRQWTILEDDGEQITAELIHRGITGHLTFTWDSDTLYIESNSTNKSGSPYVPVRWIEYLKRDIEQLLLAAVL